MKTKTWPSLLAGLLVLLMATGACTPPQDWSRPVPASEATDHSSQLSGAGEDRSAEFARKAAFYRAEYEAHYDMRVGSQDTFPTKDGQPLVVSVELYCLFDNGLIIPGRYVLEDTTRSFTTHHYAQDITVRKGSKTIFSRTLTTKDFSGYLPAEIQAYGTLTDYEVPAYDAASGQIQLSTTVAIPITDIGRRIRYAVDIDTGNLHFLDQ